MKMGMDKIRLLPDRRGRICFFVYFIAVFALLVFHECWEDELQAWCIARDLSVPEIWHQMRYEGHFALWYLLLKLPAAAGGSELMLNLTSWLLVSAAVLLFLSFRRFDWRFKLILLLSCPVFYWFPVVARNYALIPLALALLAWIYPVRLRHPWAYAAALLLLVHTHAYMEGLAGILGAFFAWDLIRHGRRMSAKAKGKVFGVLLLIGFGVLAAFLQVAPAFGASSFAPASPGSLLADWTALPARIGGVLLHLPGSFALRLSRLAGNGTVAWLFYLCLGAGAVQLFLTRRRAGIIFLAGFLWQVLFAVLIYPFALHRVYLPLLMLVFCYALPVRKTRLLSCTAFRRRWCCSLIPAALLSLMTFPETFYYVRSDILLPFSNQEQTAYFISERIPADAKIVVFPASLITGTFRAYLPDRVFCRCSDGQAFRVFRTTGKMPPALDGALLEHYMGKENTIYLLFQIGAFLDYRLPVDRERYEIGDFMVETLFASFPISFFTAGEDYMLCRVTRKAGPAEKPAGGQPKAP